MMVPQRTQQYDAFGRPISSYGDRMSMGIPYNYGPPNAMRNNPPAVPPGQQPAPGIPGRPVSCEQEIKPSEVPMDGGISVFPTQDLQRIYVKGWDYNGNLNTLVFVQEMPVAQSSPENTGVAPIQTDEIIKRLDRIEQMLGPMTPETEAKGGESK